MECYHSWCTLIVSLRMDESTENKMVIIGIIVGTLILTAIIVITNIFLACRRARQATLRAQTQAQNQNQNTSDSNDDQILEPQSASAIASRRRLRSSPLPYFNTQPPAVIRMQRAQNIPGLTLQELNLVAPVKPFLKTRRESQIHDTDADHEEENACAVCLEEMKNDSIVREMPNCAHIFNTQYVINYYLISSTNDIKIFNLNFTNHFMFPFSILSYFHVFSCIEEWATKANRCPVCNTNIIAEEKLEKMRAAIREGRDPNAPPPPRQRRRRTRGPNGGYHLYDAGETVVNPEQVQALQSNQITQQQQQSDSTSLPQPVLPVGSV